MTGFLTGSGGTVELPPLLQWSIKLTDGDPCDAFSLSFAYEASYRDALREASGFYAAEGAGRVFTGVVDDYEISLTKNGCIAEVTGRGMAAKLLDVQVRAAEYVSAQLEDILQEYVTPYGIPRVEADSLDSVSNFVVETGYTCWQVLAGFCRHSGDVFPRFGIDGALILNTKTLNKGTVIRDCVESAWYSDDRYGVIAKQILINTRNGEIQVAENKEFLDRGGSRIRVAGRTGDKIRAVWRTARQRIDDSERNARLLTLRVPGGFLAWPTERIRVELPVLGISDYFVVQTAESACDETGLTCLLTLREV